MATAKYDIHSVDSTSPLPAPKVDMKLEVLVIPVTDIDRAKAFYTRLGWRQDAEFNNGKDFHILQFTPPGSGCSIIFGKNITPAAPGSAQGMYLVVSDIEAARQALIQKGIEVTDVFHGEGESYSGSDEPYLFGSKRVSGPDRQHGSYRSFASFRDPDGNGWLLQEVTQRLPGRIDTHITNYSSASDLASAMRRASEAHGKHEARTGKADANWPDWYASYMVAEQSGEKLPD